MYCKNRLVQFHGFLRRNSKIRTLRLWDFPLSKGICDWKEFPGYQIPRLLGLDAALLDSPGISTPTLYFPAHF
jgi:hypothetical protein